MALPLKFDLPTVFNYNKDQILQVRSESQPILLCISQPLEHFVWRQLLWLREHADSALARAGAEYLAFSLRNFYHLFQHFFYDKLGTFWRFSGLSNASALAVGLYQVSELERKRTELKSAIKIVTPPRSSHSKFPSQYGPQRRGEN